MHPPVGLVAIDMDGIFLPTFAKMSRRNARLCELRRRPESRSQLPPGVARPLRSAARRTRPASGYPLITSNGAVTRLLAASRWTVPSSRRGWRVDLRGASPFGTVVFTLDHGCGELVLEDLEQAHFAALSVETNRNAIEVVARWRRRWRRQGPDQGMVTGGMKK